MSMNYKDYVAIAALFAAAFTTVLAIAAAVYLLIGYGIVYSLALMGVIEFSHSVALGVTLLVFIAAVLYQYFVEGEELVDLKFEV